MPLNTGRQIHSYQWTELPIPEQVIERVYFMAKKQNQPRLVDQTPHFEWRPDSPIAEEVKIKTETQKTLMKTTARTHSNMTDIVTTARYSILSHMNGMTQTTEVLSQTAHFKLQGNYN